MEGKFCCSDMEAAIAQSATEGMGIVYTAGIDPQPHFYLQLQIGSPSSKQFNYCPWCGEKVSAIANL